MSAKGGHNGEYKTYLRLAEDWYWEGMRKTVTELVRRCEVCQQKASHQQPAGLLQALPIPSQVWEEITMDFGVSQITTLSTIVLGKAPL